MHLGLTYFPTNYAMAPADLARAAEERAFESLFVAEHSHIPVERRSPWPGGAELPKMYYDAMDPFVALASAAAVTRNLKLGTGICLVVQRDPIQTAKAIASLDQISQGRVIFGVGAGWNAEEMANHGTLFDRRFKLMRERIEAMIAIWTHDEAEYHGEFVDFEPIRAWPKPVQTPHPPIHVGGTFPGAARRAVRYGQGWMPILGRAGQDIAALAPEFRRMAEEAGRDPASLELTVYGNPRDPEGMRHLRDAGVDRVIALLPPSGPDDLLPLLDDLAELGRSL